MSEDTREWMTNVNEAREILLKAMKPKPKKKKKVWPFNDPSPLIGAKAGRRAR